MRDPPALGRLHTDSRMTDVPRVIARILQTNVTALHNLFAA